MVAGSADGGPAYPATELDWVDTDDGERAMDRIEEMAVFVAVADLGGFAAAARALGLSAPTVTRAIAALEEQVGIELFVRTTRFVRLTESGERYLQDCRRILQELDDAEASAAGAHREVRGALVVAAPIVFGQRLLMPLLVDFLQAHPGVTARALLVDRPVHLSEEGIDCAVRMGELPDSSLVATPLGSVRRLVCGSPGYLAATGVPQRPADLFRHALVVSAADERGDHWEFRDGGESLDVAISPRLTVSTNDAAIATVRDGWGLTRVMSYQVAAELARGELVRVLEAFEPRPVPVWLVNPEGRHASGKLRRFLAFATGRLRGHPALCA